jgi:two-component system sensor histidine kinase KdpD
LSEADRDRVAATLRLAEELGGEAVTIPGQHVADDLIRLAQVRNATEIVVGKSHRSWWFELLHGSIVKELIRKSGDIDVYVIVGDEDEVPGEHLPSRVAPERGSIINYFWSAATVAGAALASAYLRLHLSLPNLSLVFLLAVLTSAVVWGLRASIFAAILSVLVYDFFLVPPYHTFTISSPQDVLSLIVFLVVAIITSNLTGNIRDQAHAAQQREARTIALYDLSREIAGASGLHDVLEAVVHRVGHIMGARVVVLLPESDSLMVQASYPPNTPFTEQERASATWAWQHNKEAGRGTEALAGDRWFYLPLRRPESPLGVMALYIESPESTLAPDQRRLLEALADQAAVAIERARFAGDIEQARLLSERERLQAILLSSISHDLRTPLASILGSATSLLENEAAFDMATRADLLTTIREEAERLNRFVGNLLDTTRLESGALKLNRDWVALDDVIGSALQRLKATLGGRHINLDIEAGLPLLHIDFVLIEQVLINLLDNAAKYSPSDTPIRIGAHRTTDNRAKDVVELTVEDRGSGLPVEDLDRVFDKFYRVIHGDRQPAGTGLGLSICRGIVEEHNGTIYAQSPGSSGTGTTFIVHLPIEEAPTVPDELLS